MTRHREEMEQRIVAEQAAQWLCDLHQGAEPEQQKLLDWLKKSPRHIREFLFAETVWEEVRQARFSSLDLNALVEEARAAHEPANLVHLASDNGLALPRGDSPGGLEIPWRPQRARAYRRIAVTACLVMAAAATLLSVWWNRANPVYSTVLGEQRSLRLEDGSWVHLNTHSRLEVQYSAQRRELHLLEGEALFTVQQDTARPFVVYAGEAVIRALGTQFNVYLGQNATSVAVVSGAVQVMPVAERQTTTTSRTAATLNAGQEAQIANGGKVLLPAQNVADAVAWRERRLVFRGTPLEAVAAEFNRYNPQQIQVEGATARRKLLSGTFDADDPASLVLFLKTLDDLTVEHRQDGLLIRSK